MIHFRPRILCIDDDTNTSNWMRIVLRGARIVPEVVVADTGMEALRRLGAEKFDLCILDYALPDMTGVQLCSMMRQLRYDVPVMFFTALNRPVDQERAKAAGANEFLCKPDDMEIFADAVDHLLGKQRMFLAEISSGKRRYPMLARAA